MSMVKTSSDPLKFEINWNRVHPNPNCLKTKPKIDVIDLCSSDSEMEEISIMEVNVKSKDLEVEEISKTSIMQANVEHEDLEVEEISKTSIMEVNLEHEDLEAEEISKTRIMEINLEHEDLEAEEISKTRIMEINLEHEDLEVEEISKTSIMQANVEHEDLEAEEISKTSIMEINLEHEDLEAEEISKTSIMQANVEHEDLEAEEISKTIIMQANVEHEDLEVEEISKTSIMEVNLEHEDLEAEEISKTSIMQANVEHEDLEVEEISKTSIMEANVEHEEGEMKTDIKQANSKPRNSEGDIVTDTSIMQTNVKKDEVKARKGKWDVHMEDMARVNPHLRAQLHCNVCNQRGHVRASCKVFINIRPKKRNVCFMCGFIHQQFKCEMAFCLRCGSESNQIRTYCNMCVIFDKQRCRVCKSQGHVAEKCTDIWRMYHNTTSASEVPTRGKRIIKPMSKQYCSNCSRRGHMYEQCSMKRPNNYYLTSRIVSSYDMKRFQKQDHENKTLPHTVTSASTSTNEAVNPKLNFVNNYNQKRCERVPQSSNAHRFQFGGAPLFSNKDSQTRFHGSTPSSSATRQPRFNVPPSTVTRQPRFNVPPSTVTRQPRFNVPPSTVTRQPRFDVPPSTATRQPRFDVPSSTATRQPRFDVPSSTVTKQLQFAIPPPNHLNNWTGYSMQLSGAIMPHQFGVAPRMPQNVLNSWKGTYSSTLSSAVKPLQFNSVPGMPRNVLDSWIGSNSSTKSSDAMRPHSFGIAPGPSTQVSGNSNASNYDRGASFRRQQNQINPHSRHTSNNKPSKSSNFSATVVSSKTIRNEMSCNQPSRS